MTENATPAATSDATNRTMSDVSHTNPKTGRPFGERVVFARGPAVAADGGEREPRRGAERSDGREPEAGTDADDVPDEADSSETADHMADVDHEPPTAAEPNRVFERGREGRDGAR